MRIQEILGLTWGDNDFRERVVRVRAQPSRGTRQGLRAGSISRRRPAGETSHSPVGSSGTCVTTFALPSSRAACHAPTPTDSQPPLVRRSTATTSQRGLDRAAEAAGLNGDDVPKLGFHDLRHTFASHLIRAGVDPVRASRQLGHARPSITLDMYAHEFEHARGLDEVRDSVDAAFGPGKSDKT